MISFKLVQHKVLSGVEIVEIWEDDTFLGAIYPGDGKDAGARCIRVISRHIAIVAALTDGVIPAIGIDFRQEAAEAVRSALDQVAAEESPADLNPFGLPPTRH